MNTVTENGRNKTHAHMLHTFNSLSIESNPTFVESCSITHTLYISCSNL